MQQPAGVQIHLDNYIVWAKCKARLSTAQNQFRAVSLSASDESALFVFISVPLERYYSAA